MSVQLHKLRLFTLISLLVLLTFGVTHAQDTTECPEGSTLFTHTMGETCVPANPQRVVALEWTYVEDLLALGIQPVGIADIEGYNEWVKIPVALDDTVVDVGDRSEPNLEIIAQLKPDLIIGVNFRLAENYDDLSAIAPTLVFNPYPDDLTVSQYAEMTTTFSTIATAVNRETEGQAVLAHMEDTYARAQAALEAAGREGEAFIVSQGWTYDSVATFRLFTDNAMAVQILEQIGLENAWDDAPQLYGFTEIGIEGFADLKDQAFNFFYVAQDSDNEFFANSPLWSNLAFVEAQQAYWMGGDVWLFGGPLSAEALVETVLTSMGIELPPSDAVQTTANTCEAGFHLFDDALLASDPVCIPENPLRIAAIDTFTLETLLSLGIKPVSGPFLETFLRDHPQFTTQLEGVTEIGWPVNPEAIIAAQPDLIISIEPWIKDIASEVAQIAPTVSIQYPGDGNWQDIVHAVGSAVNQAEALNAGFDAYNARLQTFQDLTAESSVGDVAIVFLLPDQLMPFLSDTFSGKVLLDAGLNFPAALVEAAGDGSLTDISQERLDLLSSSDHIFVVTSGFTDEDLAAYQVLIAEIEADPLWQSLPAVQAGHVHIVGRDWIGSSLIAANVVIDDLITSVAEVDPATVSPDPFLPAEASS